MKKKTVLYAASAAFISIKIAAIAFIGGVIGLGLSKGLRGQKNKPRRE